jgi:hypothetical protein
MRSGEEMGRETRVRASARVLGMGTVAHGPTDHPAGLALTDNLFSAKVESITVELRISEAVTRGFGTWS